jgi:hypothetical protein
MTPHRARSRRTPHTYNVGCGLDARDLRYNLGCKLNARHRMTPHKYNLGCGLYARRRMIPHKYNLGSKL